MNIDKMIEQWEEKHSSLLDEYSKGNANNEVMQMYRSQMNNVLDFINQLKQVKKNCSIPDVINCVAVPEWLTDEIRALAKTTWNDHKDFNDNKRVEAMRIIKRCALAAGYTITIKKATELLQQHCL